MKKDDWKSFLERKANLDPNILRLVRALNSLPAVWTFSSCGGHENPSAGQEGPGEFNINFHLDQNRRGWKSLKFIQWAIQETEGDLDERIRLDVWVDPGEDENDPRAGILCFQVKGHPGADPNELAEILEELAAIQQE